jgi:glycosyltransferase involved in cell wall biosynthesis
VLVTFLIPSYNEAPTITNVLGAIVALPLDSQIVVVDDGSSDGTAAVLERWQEANRPITYIRKEQGGKGTALIAGIPHCEGDITVFQDADMEYDPADVPLLIEPIERGAADVVFGSRLSGGRAQRAYMFWHLVGNRFLSLLTNALYNTTISDMETGYKAFRTEILRSLNLREPTFTIEPEITAKVCRRGLRIYELPVSYYGRTYDEGKKITWRDGVLAVWVLLRERFAPAG